MTEKEEKAVFLMREMGELVATFSNESWSQNGGPWLRKLGPEFLKVVTANLGMYRALYLYRYGKVNEEWCVIGMQHLPSTMPRYDAVHGFSSQTIAQIGREARTLRERWWFFPAHTREEIKTASLCAFLFLGMSIIEWKRSVTDGNTGSLWDFLWIALALFGVCSSLWDIRKKRTNFFRAAQSL